MIVVGRKGDAAGHGPVEPSGGLFDYGRGYMLQIIGWLGCLYLVIKSLEIAANPAFRYENGILKGYAIIACILGWFGAVGFALWLGVQGAAIPALGNATAESSRESSLDASIREQCIQFAKTPEEILDCK
ncbi:hypothetical protein [Novosphingobium sp. PhB165]|uniref:hypothetical protein n=1 Tax=Novosphingobium sp. PhB165 TaxID=2485105 RepID=UPI0010487C03|nr:hypothetical protein [Novosphingobium sp. PhB165]